MQLQKTINKERGIVLITCLIFLILLLTLLRFTIGSAKMSELKSGADFDEQKAQAAANYTFNDAQLIIQRVDADYVSLQDPLYNLETDEAAVIELAMQYWLESDNFKDEEGIYDGDTNPCTDQLCSNHVTDWEKSCDSSNRGFICYGKLTKAKDMAEEQGKYVIERFVGRGDKIKLDKLSPLEEVMVFRVTGKAYSEPTASTGNATDVVRQDTYILTYKSDKKKAAQ